MSEYSQEDGHGCMASSTADDKEGEFKSPHKRLSSASASKPGAIFPLGTPQEQKRAIRARGRISILRGRVIVSRVEGRHQRMEIHQLRQETADAEAEFLKALDEFMLRDGTQTLRSAYNNIREKRDVLGPATAKYEEIEDNLTYQEDELEQEELKFYQLLGMENE